VTLLGAAFRNSIENPQVPLTASNISELFGGQTMASGVRVNEESSFRLSSVFRGLWVSSAVPASLPFHAYRKAEDGTRTQARGHAADLLENPHPDMTPFELWQTVFLHRRGWGNAYLRLLRNRLGQIVELWPIHPSRVKVGRESEAGRKVYAIDGGKEVLGDDQILHLPFMGYDGVCGVSPLRAARQAIGLGLAAEEFGSKLFGSGSLATGILQTEQRLTQEQADALHARWKAKRSGLKSAHETIILDSGAKFQQLTIPPEDAQFLETRRFQTTEMCRFLGIPPFLMFETERSTSWGTGLEQQMMGWVLIDLGPDLASVEQRVTKILRPEPVYAKFTVEGLLRGDAQARSAFYRSMWDIGALSTNEIRQLEERPGVEGGDMRYRPLNMGELGTSDTTTTTPEGVPANAAS
jgi:HK97 family phage portal protein